MIEHGVAENEAHIFNEIDERGKFPSLDHLLDCMQVHRSGDNIIVVGVLQ